MVESEEASFKRAGPEGGGTDRPWVVVFILSSLIFSLISYMTIFHLGEGEVVLSTSIL
jgi:hypothetical protein